MVVADLEAMSDFAPPSALAKAKFQNPLIDRLIASKKIGGEELQAIQEIERVVEKLTIGLRFRSLDLHRVDGGKMIEPERFDQAYWSRYRPWADEWSRRRKLYGDPTLEIVFDLLFSMETARNVDARYGWRKGKATTVFISGLRDYSANAGWIDGDTARRWKAAARAIFGMRRMRTIAA